MTKVRCADVACKYHGDHDICTAKSINLSWSSIMTMWDGRQDFHQCRTFEESEYSKKVRASIAKLLGHEKRGEEQHAD